MPLKLWKCHECGSEFQTKAKAPTHCDDVQAELVLTAPKTKFMERISHEHGKSAVIGQQAVLKERARNHSRNHETHDLIQNNSQEDALKNHWINESGDVRKSIDDK